MSPTRGPRSRLQRRYPRLTLRVDVRIETPTGVFAAIATTLGAGGLFVATTSPLAPRTPIVVSFRLPGETIPMHLDAQVAWSAPANGSVRTPGMGLEFVDGDARAALAARLEEWAKSRETGAESGAEDL